MIIGNRQNKLTKHYYRNKGKRYYLPRHENLFKNKQNLRVFLKNNEWGVIRTPYKLINFKFKINPENCGINGRLHEYFKRVNSN